MLLLLLLYLELLNGGTVLVEVQLLGHGGYSRVTVPPRQNDAVSLSSTDGKGRNEGGGGELVRSE